MTLMDYCMQYIGEIMDGKRAAPEGVTLTETDPMRRSLELMQKAGDIPTLVRMCAVQDGTEIPQEVFDSFDPESLTQLAREGDAAPEEPEQQPDPDAGKHAFQVLLDCIWPLLYVGVFSCGVGYTLQILAQKGSNPTVVTILLSLESVFAVIAGAVVLHQQMTAREYLGCVLMFAAVVLAQIPMPQKKEAKAE